MTVMTMTPLEERIGDALEAECLQHLYEQIAEAPVLPLYQKLQNANVPVNVPMEALAPERGKAVASAWLEVCAYLLNKFDPTETVQEPNNVSRVAQYFDRAVPEGPPPFHEILTAYAICRIRAIDGPQYLQHGIRGKSGREEIVVLLPLQPWTVENGLFIDGQVKVGQDISLGGAESVRFPGTGGCSVLLLFLRLPVAARDSGGLADRS